MPRISVVIPVYNDADLLKICLDALAGQTRPADEIVVVDNGSTDASAHVARSAGARIVVEPQRGIPAATSAGFDAATGEIFARIDADSIPADDWLENLESVFVDRPEISAATGPAEFYGGTAFDRWFGRSCYLPSYFWTMERLLGHPPLFGSNCAIRADAWQVLRQTAHRSRADVHDDLDLSFQFRPGMTVHFEPDLSVAVSARPFSDWSTFARRVTLGVGTVAVNTLAESPWKRRAARRAA
ncbi:MAG: glycosyltransferase [Mycetocola sp.]